MYGDQEIIVLTGICMICGIVGFVTVLNRKPPGNPKNPKDGGLYWDL